MNVATIAMVGLELASYRLHTRPPQAPPGEHLFRIEVVTPRHRADNVSNLSHDLRGAAAPNASVLAVATVVLNFFRTLNLAERCPARSQAVAFVMSLSFSICMLR